MAYPVELTIEYPERLSRWLNNPFLIWIKFLLAIPHFIVLYLYQIAASIVWFIALWVILFTGRYPGGLFQFYAGYLRWSNRITAYILSMTDKYPPFSGDDSSVHPVQLRLEQPERLSRLLNNPFLFWIKFLLLIPHFVVLLLYAIAWYVVWFIALWVILFTGRFPRGMFEFSVGFFRWSARLNAYMYSLTDKYPPFSGKPSDAPMYAAGGPGGAAEGSCPSCGAAFEGWETFCRSCGQKLK